MPPLPFVLLLLIPLVILAATWWHERDAQGRQRIHSATVAVLLAAAAFWLAQPFLTQAPVGSGEAYNYSLAIADGVQQLRAGELPVLVGQTEFAFNGRIHPVRNAPYLIYLAGGLDLLTFRQLDFWSLQNLSLGFSLVLSLFLAWFALRWSSGAGPWTAGLLAFLYGASSAVLGAAYGQDLFMTVHAAPFVPLALAAAARSVRRAGATSDIVLAVALTAVWWAHPPVALWTTGAALVVRLVAWALRPSWSNALTGVLGLFATIVMMHFVVVSATEVTPYGEIAKSHTLDRQSFLRTLEETLQNAVPATLLPVSAGARELTDLQLGYSLAALLIAVVWFSGRGRAGLDRERRWIAGLLALLAGGLLVLALPIPGITLTLWSWLPSAAYTLTSIWPMQRLYLVAGAAVVLSGAWLLPQVLVALNRRQRLAAAVGILLLVGWTAFQAVPFLQRGLGTRWPEARAAASHRPQNLDLTITSYSFLGLPATFQHGVSEPWAEFALLEDGRTSTISNYQAARADGRVVAEGAVQRAADAPSTHPWRAQLRLEPGQRYLLEFEWRAVPAAATLVVTGPSTARTYQLPASGERRSFGIGGEHRPGFALTTSAAEAEDVEVLVHQTAGEPLQPDAEGAIASFRLIHVEAERLPVQVHTLLPLRATVRSPAAYHYVETPRRFIPGYDARVNGRSVRAVRSPDGNVMLPVPAGESQVELRYTGSRRLRTAFWSSVLAGVALLAFVLVVWRRREAGHPTPGWVPLGASVAVGLATVGIGLRERALPLPTAGAGPLRFEVLLPSDRLGASEAILASGEPGAGNIVYLVYEDEAHLQVGVDVWGKAVYTGRARVDYRQPQEITVQAGFLLPADDPQLQAFPEWKRRALRSQLRVEVNGEPVIDEVAETFDVPWEQVTIGHSAIGGSLAQPEFTGRLRAVRRLPLTPAVDLAQPLALPVRWPDERVGVTEPLLAGEWADGTELFTITYLDRGGATLGYWRDGALIQQAALEALSRQQTLEWRPDGSRLLWLVDRAVVMTIEDWHGSNGRAFIHWAGVNEGGVDGVAARFTGEWTKPLGLDGDLHEDWGPVRMLVRFPTNVVGTAEPLVATGETGRADVLYVRYVAEDQVQFGLDHWGIGSVESEPVTLAPDALHRLEISMGSLFPPLPETGAAAPAAKAEVVVRVDGAEVWRVQQPTYDVPKDALRIGDNSIGASSCGPAFTGEILLLQRGAP